MVSRIQCTGRNRRRGTRRRWSSGGGSRSDGATSLAADDCHHQSVNESLLLGRTIARINASCKTGPKRNSTRAPGLIAGIPPGLPDRLRCDPREKMSRLILPDRMPSLRLASSLAIRNADDAGRPGGAGGDSHPVVRTHGGIKHACVRGRNSPTWKNSTNEATCHFGREERVAGIRQTSPFLPFWQAERCPRLTGRAKVARSRRRTSATGGDPVSPDCAADHR